MTGFRLTAATLMVVLCLAVGLYPYHFIIPSIRIAAQRHFCRRVDWSSGRQDRASPTTRNRRSGWPRPCRDRRFEWAYLFAAVEPATGADVALVLPEATTRTMSVFLAAFSRSLSDNVHAVLVLDRAGWHGAKALKVPANITLIPLPPYSPELNPVERIWLYLRERFLSLRVFKDYHAIVDA